MSVSVWLTLALTRTYDNRGRILSEADVNADTSTPLYSYSIPGSGGYDAAGNVKQVADSVIGPWTYGYDTLNRLTSGAATGASGTAPYASMGITYSYDNWGNFLQEQFSGSPTESVPYPQTEGYTGWSHVNGSVPAGAPIYNNRMDAYSYDASGNVLDDGTSQYLYDGEGRICAAYRYYLPYSMTQYIYDGLGHRVEKGSITTFSCDRSSNGYTPTEDYVVRDDGKVMLTSDSSGNVNEVEFMDRPSGGQLLSSLSAGGIFVMFNDWLGTKRAEVTQTGQLGQTYLSLPYGEGLNWNTISSPDVSDKHFTGQPQDLETGLSYFGARYYAPYVTRWMSPDFNDIPDSVPYADFDNPQSLNLYSYGNNNPLNQFDPDGHAPCDAQADAKTVVNPGLLCKVWNFLKQLGGPGSGPEPGSGPDDFWPNDFGHQVAVGLQRRADAAVPVIAGGGILSTLAAALPEAAATALETAAEAETSSVEFGKTADQTAHALRHVIEEGMNPEEVQEAIKSDIGNANLRAGSNTRIINVGGRTLRYNAYRFANGAINVGKIVVEK